MTETSSQSAQSSQNAKTTKTSKDSTTSKDSGSTHTANHPHKTGKETVQDLISSIPSTDQIEDKIDAVAADLTHKIEGVVSPELSSKTGHIMGTVDSLLNQIEEIIISLGSMIPASPNRATNDATLNIDYKQQISRLLIFRRLRLIIQMPILYVWCVWISIVFVVYYVWMLLSGTRNTNMHSRIVRFFNHVSKRSSYILGLTDRRPEILVK